MSYPPEAWERLGRLLISRRVQIDPAFRNRQKFIAATGLHERLVSDLERGRRFSYRAATIDAVEAAYGLIPDTFDRSLQQGVLFVAYKDPAHAQAKNSPAVADDSAAVPELEHDWFPVLPGGKRVTADGYAVPPKPKSLEMPPRYDPTSFPLHEVHLMLTPNTTVDERAKLILKLRGLRQEEQEAAALLREANGSD